MHCEPVEATAQQGANKAVENGGDTRIFFGLREL